MRCCAAAVCPGRKSRFVVQVHTVSDTLEPGLGAKAFHYGEEFVLAVEATVAIVPDVIRPVELIRLQNFQWDKLARLAKAIASSS